MTRRPGTIGEPMKDTRVHRPSVVDGEVFVGIVTEGDLRCWVGQVVEE